MTEDRTDQDHTQSYWTGQIHAGHPALFAQYEQENAATLRSLQPALDIPYGPQPREVFDVFPVATSSGVLIYFHGGYWQSRDKAQFRFLAPAFVARGIEVVLVNYPLCPDVPLEALVGSARESVPTILAHAGKASRRPVVIAGHSAGGHLAAELAMTDWCRHGHGPLSIAGALSISGVFELTPLLRTPVNDRLGLNQARAEALSPLRRVAGPLPAAVFVVGGDETPAFQAQSADMHATWQATGSASQLVTAAGANHYSVLRQFTPGHAAFDAAMALFVE